MKTMTKKTLPAIAAATTLALVACSDDDNPSSSTAASPFPTEQTFIDQTLSCTNALDGVISGNPLGFELLPADDDDVAPSPPSIGADVPVTYFGPPPTSINRNLVGPLQLLNSGTLNLDDEVASITLPLYEGRLSRPSSTLDGAAAWYVVTDTSDRDNADALGLNHSAKLSFADFARGDSSMSRSVRQAYYELGGQQLPGGVPIGAAVLVFEGGAVDFNPVRSVAVDDDQRNSDSPTRNLLADINVQPGAVGSNNDADGYYSPLVQIQNAGGHVYNAPMVAFGVDDDALAPYCDGISAAEEEQARTILHDSVVSICPGDDGEPGTVTLEMVNGFSFGRPVQYLSTDASHPVAAALEGAIYSPALANVPVGADDSLFSAVERIFGFTNGPENIDNEANPQRQGFNSALVDGGGPLNVLGGIPTVATDYSPLWDLNLGQWTPEAIENGYRSRLFEEFAILGFVERGFITGPGPKDAITGEYPAYGSSGIIINCPIVHRFL
ncbi:Uncharacterised protein [BD1-7 clade bacterium]|nr:Uncharacterised protein [BD1-7 clade bacterium]